MVDTAGAARGSDAAPRHARDRTVLQLWLSGTAGVAAGWALHDLLGGGAFALVVVAGAAGAVVLGVRAARRLRDRETRLAFEEQELRTQREIVVQTVSHEFRTPLAVIDGVVETLLERDQLPPELQRSLLKSLRSAAHRLGELTDVVLAVVEPLGRDQHDVVRIDALVDDIAREFARLRGPERVLLELGDEAFALISNPARIRLILRAIIENGLRFSPLDAPVRVRTDREGIHFATLVRDSGEGLHEEFLTRAFEPLTQQEGAATREHSGLGIGLFAAHRATVQLGGNIELTPRADGVDVLIRLPQRREADLELLPRP